VGVQGARTTGVSSAGALSLHNRGLAKTGQATAKETTSHGTAGI